MPKTHSIGNTNAQQVDHDKREGAILEVAHVLLDAIKEPLTAFIDAAFFFRFEPEVVERVQGLRVRFMGRVDPFPTDEESKAWFDRTLGTRRDVKRNEAWLDERRKLAADYCIQENHAGLLVLRGGVPALSWIDVRTGRRDELSRPYTELRIYGQPALDALRTGRDVYDFSKDYPGHLEWEHAYLGDRYVEDPWGRKKKTQKAMAPTTRIRAWTIHYLRRTGGGRRTLDQAIDLWNREMKKIGKSSFMMLIVDTLAQRRRVQRDIRRVTATMEWLTKRDQLIAKHFQEMIDKENTAL